MGWKREHIMNRWLIRLGPWLLGPWANRQRRCRMREERGPASSVAVERREAPHPYVIGVRAPSQGARRTLARFARVPRKHPAPPGAPFPLRAREKEKGERATPGARKSKGPGGIALPTR